MSRVDAGRGGGILNRDDNVQIFVVGWRGITCRIKSYSDGSLDNVVVGDRVAAGVKSDPGFTAVGDRVAGDRVPFGTCADAVVNQRIGNDILRDRRTCVSRRIVRVNVYGALGLTKRVAGNSHSRCVNDKDSGRSSWASARVRTG